MATFIWEDNTGWCCLLPCPPLVDFEEVLRLLRVDFVPPAAEVASFVGDEVNLFAPPCSFLSLGGVVDVLREVPVVVFFLSFPIASPSIVLAV